MRLEDLYRCKNHSYLNMTNGKVLLIQGHSEGEIEKNTEGDRETDVREGQAVPIWKKSDLTIMEVGDYSSIGINNLRKFCNEYENILVFWVGTKRLVKYKKLDELTKRIYTI